MPNEKAGFLIRLLIHSPRLSAYPEYPVAELVGAQRRCARLPIDGLDSLYRETGIQTGF